MLLNLRVPLLCVLLLPGQDPASRPTPPQGADSRPALPPVTEPFRSAVERKDLIQRFQPPSPIAGFWELRKISAPSLTMPEGFKGYLVIGDRHMSLHLIGPGVKPEIPFFQSGFRRYRVVGDQIWSTSLLGVTNKENGEVLVDSAPIEERRTFLLAGSQLRISKPTGEYLEFVRIE